MAAASDKKKPIRIWVDGCFDGMHYGHANALRQAKLMGDYLVVGVHSDLEIERNKGPTVMNEQERYAAVAACKWVDEIVPDAPYNTMLEFLDKYNCDFCVHGDDITTMADGTDCYQAVKDAGRYKECKRTPGISTTDLVTRILARKEGPNETRTDNVKPPGFNLEDAQEKLRIFANNRSSKPGDRVVYVPGSFDMFHTGHIELLKKARAEGDFVICGVFGDEVIRQKLQTKYPVMNMLERALSVLTCRYVDDVIMDAPVEITADFLAKHKIDVVCHTTFAAETISSDAFKAAKDAGKLKEIPNSLPNVSSESILSRILDNYLKYEERNKRKAAKAALEAEMEAAEAAAAAKN